jgi:hypothetical protein
VWKSYGLGLHILPGMHDIAPIWDVGDENRTPLPSVVTGDCAE